MKLIFFRSCKWVKTRSIWVLNLMTKRSELQMLSWKMMQKTRWKERERRCCQQIVNLQMRNQELPLRRDWIHLIHVSSRFVERTYASSFLIYVCFLFHMQACFLFGSWLALENIRFLADWEKIVKQARRGAHRVSRTIVIKWFRDQLLPSRRGPLPTVFTGTISRHKQSQNLWRMAWCPWTLSLESARWWRNDWKEPKELDNVRGCVILSNLKAMKTFNGALITAASVGGFLYVVIKDSAGQRVSCWLQ